MRTAASSENAVSVEANAGLIGVKRSGRNYKPPPWAVGCYVVYGLTTGAIFAKCKAWRRTFRRNEDATGYWSAIVAYVVLAGMLLTQIRGPRPRR